MVRRRNLLKVWPDEVVTINQSAPGPHAPREVVQAIEMTHLSVPVLLLEESIVEIDFGQSFNPQPSTTQYSITPLKPSSITNSLLLPTFGCWHAQSLRFVRDTRSSPLFWQMKKLVKRDFVSLFGKLPDPWWNLENGQPKSPDYKSSIREILQGIGEEDEPPIDEEGPMIEIVGTRLEEVEVELLSDLLENPEERITIQEVVRL